MGQVQYIPSQDRWANLGSDIGQAIGGSIAQNQMQKQAATELSQALSIINNNRTSAASPDSSKYINDAAGYLSGVSGLPGSDVRQAIANAQTGYNTAYSALQGINQKLADPGIDQTTKNSLTAQANSLNKTLAGYHAQAQWLRDNIIAPNNMPMTGLTADDDVAAWMKSHPYGTNDFYNKLAGQANANEIPANQATSDNIGRGLSLLSGKAPNGNAGNGTPSLLPANLFGNNNQPVADQTGDNSLLNQAAQADALKQYQITDAMLAKNPQIAAAAKSMALQNAMQNYNPNQFSNNTMADLIKAGVSPKIIAELQPLVDKAAQDVGTNYFANYLRNSNGNTKDAALYALANGMPSLIPTAELFANNYQTDKVDTGKNVNYVDIGTNKFGGQPSFIQGLSLNKSTTPGEDQVYNIQNRRLSQDAQQFTQKLKFSYDQLAQEKYKADRQFAIEQQKVAQGNDQNAIAKLKAYGQQKAVIQAQIAGINQEISNIYDSVPYNGTQKLTQADKDRIASLQNQLDAARGQYVVWNQNFASAFGVTNTSSDGGQSNGQFNVYDWINSKVAAGASRDEIRQKLQAQHYPQEVIDSVGQD